MRSSSLLVVYFVASEIISIGVTGAPASQYSTNHWLDYLNPLRWFSSPSTRNMMKESRRQPPVSLVGRVGSIDRRGYEDGHRKRIGQYDDYQYYYYAADLDTGESEDARQEVEAPNKKTCVCRCDCCDCCPCSPDNDLTYID